ncbi:MAG: pantetheine-phosphate adenylyltransferase [Bacteroidota bacterium]|nr:pantetheine-phosphate adenylyltransferase [Bacteroidota bacterium]
MSNRIALFPGSFDPITLGHVDIMKRAIPLFDRLIIAIGTNSQKQSLFTLDQRLEWLHQLFDQESSVEIAHYEGLTAHYCQKIGAQYLIRGLRNGSDFDYEKTISHANEQVAQNLETIFFIAKPELSFISSTIVRELILGGADVGAFVPDVVRLIK